jgi:hypothetical protein
MKVVLSRKGFDSSYGGMPSPILPDGTLLSLPIPAEGETNRYGDLRYGSQSYLDIIRQLKPSTKIKPHYTCHLDPDLVEGVVERTVPWRPLFGQCNQSQQHLAHHGIGTGDLFLFWGWFRQTEFHQGGLRYCTEAPEVHLTWGYMKVKRVATGKQMPPEYAYHPHGRLSLKSNAIYEGDPACTGVLGYHPYLVLTKQGMTRSKWEVPDFFRRITISFHSAESFCDGYFQSAKRGQEFVLEECQEAEEWANELIGKSEN